MAIRIRAHSDLLLTARNKATMASSKWDSWSGDHPQTVLFPLDEVSAIEHNLAITNEFLRALNPTCRRYGGFIAHDVSPEKIANYISSYQTHVDAVSFRPRALSNWILSRSLNGELTDWTVFIASPEGRKSVRFGELEVGLVERSRISSHSIGALLDPRHEGVDLPDGPSVYQRESGSLDAEAMRRARPITQGLLIVYPLDPRSLGVEEKISCVIGLALSLPFTTDIATEWVVNTGVSDD